MIVYSHFLAAGQVPSSLIGLLDVEVNCCAGIGAAGADAVEVWSDGGRPAADVAFHVMGPAGAGRPHNTVQGNSREVRVRQVGIGGIGQCPEQLVDRSRQLRIVLWAPLSENIGKLRITSPDSSLGQIKGEIEGAGEGKVELESKSPGKSAGTGTDAVNSSTAPADQSTCDEGSSTCNVLGNTPCRIAITILITP
ncbi:hypothetical protein ACFQ1S_33500, partial [Kibdelosporangium lantanae]